MKTNLGGVIHYPRQSQFSGALGNKLAKHSSKPAQDLAHSDASQASPLHQSSPVVAWVKMALRLIREGQAEKRLAKKAAQNRLS